MGSQVVGSVLGTVLGVGSSMYSAKQQNKLQQEQINTQKELNQANIKLANDQLAETKRQNNIAQATNQLEVERNTETNKKRRNSIFQTSNYGNENFGSNILG